jgi:hypothetical protein
MNSYTAEELREIIVELISVNIYTLHQNVYIKFNNLSIGPLPVTHFLAIVFLDPVVNLRDIFVIGGGVDKEYCGLDQETYKKLLGLKKFIYEVPFNQVPLYLNVYDVLVAWRLRIGK